MVAQLVGASFHAPKKNSEANSFYILGFDELQHTKNFGTFTTYMTGTLVLTGTYCLGLTGIKESGKNYLEVCESKWRHGGENKQLYLWLQNHKDCEGWPTSVRL